MSSKSISPTGWTYTSSGQDALWGKAAAITLPPISTPGNDVLKGDNGTNGFYGQGGNDTIYGYGGVDVIAGGKGNDKLYGGADKDTFYFDTKLSEKTNVDKIMDFKAVDDVIALRKSIFTKVGAYGELKETAFYMGKKAHDKDDRIIYDKGTGSLYYDPDGTGSAVKIKFAILANKALITYQDFAVS